MTRDEVIALAREAGLERVVELRDDGTRTVELPHPDLLERFAALVAAHEREACAKVCEELVAWYRPNPGGTAAKAIRSRT